MAPLTINGYEIPWIDTKPPEDNTDMAVYMKQTRRTDVLPKGWSRSEEKRPLPCDIIYDQNVEIIHKDGAKIYCDILRPVTDEKVPAILSLSPYGKGGHGTYIKNFREQTQSETNLSLCFRIYDNCPFRLGILAEHTSGLEKFEGVDPAEWAPRGYAVVNVDIRGAWESEGNLYIEGTQPGIDAYDVIEFIAALDWCTGGVTMAGNSWLATTQWSAAIAKPPSLKCIAPWEGFTDKYRDVACRGGVPKRDFLAFIFDKTIRGRQKREDLAKALEQWPLMNPYWEDKALNTSIIGIPTYALASYCSGIHVPGTIRAFNSLKIKEKWLRVHPTHEWFDLYSKEATDDLQRFFDRYLKGIDNGWEKTSPVRVSILTFGSRDGPQPFVNLPFTEYPPKETTKRKLFLAASDELTASPEANVSSVSYQSDDLEAKPVEFLYVFNEPTKVIGHSKVKLWVSCNDNDDMDIFASFRKVGKSGKILEHINVPWAALPEGVNTQEDVPNANTIKYVGPTGVLRVSHREQDAKRSTDLVPFHPHTKEEKVAPGTITPVEIGIWPAGIHFEKGEGLLLRVQGSLDQYAEFPRHIRGKPRNLNKGKHTIHFGGEYDSHLIFPTLSS